ncbi:hypothetical protein IGI04_040637 [Brassica rapa subsp. trilocularis]|uniref:Uncharacterized protein n=1 Tax=Brassica rapa subsp. trilocularis TaxID=1813537 RepID=A0ABQ7KSI1_BRACM|nr:hypothetical protein IGI04_040637 [Brassica rapa subsp. trilocularis]
MGRTEAFIRFRDDVTKVEKVKASRSSGARSEPLSRLIPLRLLSASTNQHFPAEPIPRESASEPRLTRSAGLGPLFDGLCGWVKSIPNSKSPPSSLMVEQSIFDEFGVFSSERTKGSIRARKGAVSSRDSAENPDSIHHGAMMDTENMDLAQRLLRLSLFTRAEQKEINRAKTMKQLPDLSLIVAGKIGAKRGASENRVGPSGLEVVEATPIATEQARTGGSSQGKSSKKSKKSAGGPKDSSEPEHPGADGSSKKGGKKRKAGDPPSEDIPKKKRMKKKEPAPPRSSSVCEEELQALVPEAIPEVGTSEDDENETIALRRRRRESRVTEEVFRGALAGDLRSTEVPRGISTSGGQRDRLRNESPAHVTEGSETRVSGRPKETPADGFRFEFNRELPLACYPEDCARLLRLVKGGPDQLPSVGDLIFKDEYEHASCSSVKSHGDWNVLVEKYDSSLRRAREQIRESEEAKKRMEEALRVSTREKADAIAREKALRKAFDETRTSDAAELQMCKESMNNLEFVPTDQDIDPAKQASAGAVVLKDGAVPTIVLTDSPAKASKNASSSASSSEDPEKGDDALAGMPTADATAPAPTKFGRVSGPGEGDGRGNEDPPVVD